MFLIVNDFGFCLDTDTASHLLHRKRGVCLCDVSEVIYYVDVKRRASGETG